MRTLTAYLLALALVPVVAGQMGVAHTEHQMRLAYGDIPSTDSFEPGNQWNIEQLFLVNPGDVRTVNIPAGHTYVNTTCQDSCNFTAELNASKLQISCDSAGVDGFCSLEVAHWINGSPDAFGISMNVPGASTVFVYTPNGLEVRSGVENALPDDFPYPNISPPLYIHQFEVEDRVWLTVQPESTIALPVEQSSLTWQGILVGAIAGAVAWYLLVRQGMVQKRQRRQVAGTAAHKVVAAKESLETLEWRRKALLAAMKELEKAKMEQAIKMDVYDALKADFKRQTVTVMRALEETGPDS